MGKQILHIDFDSFFASVEQQFNPNLRGIPIGVTAANGRTCIIASSREAKVLGIKTGTRSFEAEAIYPGIKLISADFVKYWKVSQKFINICKDYSPFLEVFSIDELFMDVTATSHLFDGVDSIIQSIKKRIREQMGSFITVSVGISHNKMLAKMASGLKKPNGVFTINKNNIDDVYKTAELTDVCGIGRQVKLRLNKNGIYSLLQLRDMPLSLLVKEFGNVEAGFLKNVGLGLDSSEIISYTEVPDVKSVSRNYCLPKNEYDKRVVMQNIYELCEEVGIKLRRLGKKARTVGLSLKGSDNFHVRKTYKKYFDTGKEIFEACCHSGLPRIDSGVAGTPQNDDLNYVRKISVWVSNLEDAINTPSSLFDSEKKNSLQVAIDEINDRFGDHTIRNGFLLYSDKLTTVPNGYMADRYERTQLALQKE